MKKKKLAGTVLLSLFWCVLILAVLGGATYAWFSFNPYTNVEPMSSAISEGDAELLISRTQDGNYDTECALDQWMNGTFIPVSTTNLDNFYKAVGQNKQGIAISYTEVKDSITKYAVNGKLFLQSKNKDCKVYFYKSGLDFGTDQQALAALRLGMKIKTNNGTNTYIFHLNDMGNTGGAAVRQTVTEKNTVVKSLTAGGGANYETDPALSLTPYFAVEKQENENPDAGEKELCTLAAEEIAEVEYWLYLEGCDENCSNEVQARDIRLQLAFAGVTAEEPQGSAE